RGEGRGGIIFSPPRQCLWAAADKCQCSTALAPRVRRDATQFGGHLRFVAGGCAVETGRPKIVGQSRPAIECTRLLAQMCVRVGLVEQRDRLSLPFFWVDGFAA